MRSLPYRVRIHSRPTRGYLWTLEGSSFVSGFAFPDNRLVGFWPVLGSRLRNGLDFAVDQRNDFPIGHVAVDVAYDVFCRRPEQEVPIRKLKESERAGFVSNPWVCASMAS